MRNLVEAAVAKYRDKEWEQRLIDSVGQVYDDPTRNGCFQVPVPRLFKCVIAAIASSGGGWDHVSVQIAHQGRLPTWDEMCFAKEIFFYPNECVIQYHPPNDDYINENPRVLHLWRPLGMPLPMPPKEMV